MFGRKDAKQSLKGPSDKAKPEPEKHSKLSKVPLLGKLGKKKDTDDKDNGQKHDTNVPEYCVPNPDGYGPASGPGSHLGRYAHTNPKLPNIVSATTNVGMKSLTFETIVKNLISICLTSASHLFEHIRYLELYSNQLKIDLANQNSETSDDIASAMLIIWEVDRVMIESHWEKLTSYAQRYSRHTPMPILIVANLSEAVMNRSADYVRHLVRDVQWFLTASFDPSPSKHLWKAVLMRNNLFQPAYFKAHVHWLYSKAKRHPRIHIRSNLEIQIQTSQTSTTTEQLRNAEYIPYKTQDSESAKARFLDTQDFRKLQWYSGLDGDHFLSDFSNSQLAHMHVPEFEALMNDLSTSIQKAEQQIGRQQWRCGEVTNGFAHHIICHPESSPDYVVDLPKPIRAWEVTLLITQAIPRMRKTGLRTAHSFVENVEEMQPLKNFKENTRRIQTV